MKKKVVFYFVTVMMVIFISIIGGEVMLRVFDKIKGVTPPYTHNLPECLAVPSGYFNFDLQPSLKVIHDWKNPRVFTINKWGFRAPEYEPVKPKGLTRIFCFGGSSTFDPYVPDEKTWSYLIGEKLSKKTNHKIESINAGRYGYTTSEILSLFYHRVLRHDPDLIIIYSTYNDSGIVVSPYYSLDDAPAHYGNPILSFFNKRSALFAFLNYKLRYSELTSAIYAKIVPYDAYYKKPPIEHEKFVKDEGRAMGYRLELYKRNLKTIIHIAKDNNVKVLISTQLTQPNDKRPWRLESVRLITEAAREIAREEGVPILDFDKMNITDSQQKTLLQSYVHLTPEGCEFVSDRMVEAILKNSLIED